MKRLPAQLLTLAAALGIMSCAAPVVESKPKPKLTPSPATPLKKSAASTPAPLLTEASLPAPLLLPLAPVASATLPPAPPEPAPVAPPPPKPGTVSQIPLGTFFDKQQTGQVLIYDVRPAFHYSLGHIPSAINWPKNRFESGLPNQEPRLKAAIAAEKPIVLYCTDPACPDARTVAAELSLLGYDTAILAGGWEAWKLGELPIE